MNIKTNTFVNLKTLLKTQTKGDFDPRDIFKKSITSQITDDPNTQIIDDNNNKLNEEDVTDIFLSACGDFVNKDAEQNAKKIIAETTTHYNENTIFPFDSMFQSIWSIKYKLPEPTNKILYTTQTDVIPSARNLISLKNNLSEDDMQNFAANIAFTYRPNIFGVICKDEDAFNELKKYIKNQINIIKPNLDAKVIQSFDDFNKTKLDGLTLSLLIRNNENHNNENNSFARLLPYLLNAFIESDQNKDATSFTPFSLNEFIIPKIITFINVEKHAKETVKNIEKEWKNLNDTIKTKPQILSNRQIRNLTKEQNNQNNITKKIQKANSKDDIATQRVQAPLKDTRMSNVEVYKIILKILNKMGKRNKSQNPFKTEKKTYQRPNRRDPDNFNLKGKTTTTNYKPDLHIYIDTSGSISEENYSESIKMCIALAKKLNINLYVNSFSHVLSQSNLLKTQNKSSKMIYKTFQRLPKVTGGTDYKQIWNYINNSKKRKDELSLIITDFEYWAPSKFIAHPKNLYYIPCSKIHYDSIKYSAYTFMDTMKHIDSNIRSKLIM